MHRHTWSHRAIIPHIPINKPSSAEVIVGQQMKLFCLQSPNAMDAEEPFSVLHRLCLREIVFTINARLQHQTQIIFKKKVLFSYEKKSVYFLPRIATGYKKESCELFKVHDSKCKYLQIFFFFCVCCVSVEKMKCYIHVLFFFLLSG